MAQYSFVAIINASDDIPSKEKLIQALGYEPEHFKLDIRFEHNDVVVLVETKQNFTVADEAQLKEYLTGQYSDGYVQYTKMFSSIDKHLKIGGFINQTEHNYYSEFSISISELSSFQSVVSCGFNSG